MKTNDALRDLAISDSASEFDELSVEVARQVFKKIL